MKRPTLLAAALLLVLTSCSPSTPPEAPPVFSHLTLAQARSQVAGTPKVLIVKATASWCPPCKQMNKTSWRDPRVEKWVADHGIAIELDVDQSTQDARALRITAMPTMLAFKDGEEFDRTVGFLDGDQLLAWLGAVERGERAGLSGPR